LLLAVKRKREEQEHEVVIKPCLLTPIHKKNPFKKSGSSNGVSSGLGSLFASKPEKKPTQPKLPKLPGKSLKKTPPAAESKVSVFSFYILACRRF